MSQNIKLLGTTCSEVGNFEWFIACLGETNTRLQFLSWALGVLERIAEIFGFLRGVKNQEERGKSSISFFSIYICLINTSIITGIWEFRFSGCLFMSLCWWYDRVMKRAGDDRIGNWMYSVIMLQALQIINIRHRVWNWIFKTPVDFLWLAQVQKTR